MSRLEERKTMKQNNSFKDTVLSSDYCYRPMCRLWRDKRDNERKYKDRRAEQGKRQQLTAAVVKQAERQALDPGFKYTLSRLISLHP